MLYGSFNLSFLQIRKVCIIFLAFFILCGFAFGIYTAGYSDVSVYSLVRTVSCCRVSTVNRILAVLLPFAFSAVAVALSNSLLLYPLIFIKCFLYSFYMFCICSLFEQGNWLACLLFLFSDTAALFALLIFVIHYISGFNSTAYIALFAVASLSFGFSVVDSIFITPFLTTLLS